MDLKTKLANGPNKEIHLLLSSLGLIRFTSASKLSSLTSLGVCFDQTQDDITWNSHLLQNAQKHAEIKYRYLPGILY